MIDPALHLTPELLLKAYAAGISPMSENRNDPEIFWVDPRRRGVLPLNGFHISRSLARRMRQAAYGVSMDADFAGVLNACADREETWINAEIHRLYMELHHMGTAHSLEIWQDGALAGGVCGGQFGGVGVGGDMVSPQNHPAKLALAHLTD